MQTESGGEESKEPEEPKVMTLDEYKKQQGERSGPKFNLRKAGEGSEIDPKWKKTYAYKKEKETHDEEEDEVIEIIFFIASSIVKWGFEQRISCTYVLIFSSDNRIGQTIQMHVGYNYFVIKLVYFS